MSDTPKFPVLSPEQMEKRLTPPPAGSRIRVVIDTDVDNEIDDFFALAWMFLSRDRFQIEGMYAAGTVKLTSWTGPERHREHIPSVKDN